MREATKEERKSVNNYIESISQKAIIIPDGATNGDVMKAVFPNLHFSRNSLESEYIVFVNHHPLVECSDDWWNALYKKEGDGE